MNDRVNVTLAWPPLTVLCSTAVPSFQFPSTFVRSPSTSAALITMVYNCPAVTLAPLVLVSVSVGLCWIGGAAKVTFVLDLGFGEGPLPGKGVPFWSVALALS